MLALHESLHRTFVDVGQLANEGVSMAKMARRQIEEWVAKRKAIGTK
jgi:hypothetical protein